MSKAPVCRNSLIWLSIAAMLLTPGSLHAEDHDTALFAISLNDGRVTAGTMCSGTEYSSIDPAGDPPKSWKFAAPRGGMCRRSNSSVLNPDVLAFDVTRWPRQAIAELASRLHLMDDPLNFDFSRVTLAGRQIRRIEEALDEALDEEAITPPAFKFSFGCYLLMTVPRPTSVSES